MTEIWCVEDDESIREIEMYTLESMNFKVRGFDDGQSFFKALDNSRPDLVILDLMLPDEDGSEILHRLRSTSATEDLPVIVASAKTAEYDKVKNLDSGADDYLTKPFGMMEMVSRIKAVLRRSQKGEKKEKVSYGQLSLDTKNYIVRRNRDKINLTLKEFDLLSLLMFNPDRVFTRQELLDKVWGEHFLGETRTVDVHIGTLRTKLGDCGDYIKTVRGVGYRLEAADD